MTDLNNSNTRLQGKIAIITGGSSGIGEATARHFIKHGARAVVIADIQDESGQKLATSLNSDQNRCIYIHCNVIEEDEVKSLVDTTIGLFGRVDIMFSNAGILTNSLVQTVLELDLSSYDKVFAVNARGMAACVKHAARVMVEGNVKGSIVCTGSVVSTVGTELFSDYTMSKHAVLGLVKCAALQLGRYGIRVNCVSPGAVETPMFYAGVVGYEISTLEGVIQGGNVADVVVFLASDEAQFVTGSNLLVEGGFKL